MKVFAAEFSLELLLKTTKSGTVKIVPLFNEQSAKKNSYELEVKIIQTGRGGTIHYAETGKELAFDWEFAIAGALVFVPSPPHWNNFVLRNYFPQAQNRRDEILERICEEIIRQKSGGRETLNRRRIYFNFISLINKTKFSAAFSL